MLDGKLAAAVKAAAFVKHRHIHRRCSEPTAFSGAPNASIAIHPAWKDELRGADHAVDTVVMRSVKLTRRGPSEKGVLPVPEGETPSFYVNDQKQLYARLPACGVAWRCESAGWSITRAPIMERGQGTPAEAGMEVSRPTPPWPNAAGTTRQLIE